MVAAVVVVVIVVVVPVVLIVAVPVGVVVTGIAVAPVDLLLLRSAAAVGAVPGGHLLLMLVGVAVLMFVLHLLAVTGADSVRVLAAGNSITVIVPHKVVNSIVILIDEGHP